MHIFSAPPKCGQNEVLTECKTSCSNETCSSIMNPQVCPGDDECGGLGCVCKDGYFRIEENAPCIPFCECPKMKDSQACSSTYLFKLLGL